MTEITLHDISAGRCLEIVYALRETMTQGKDFTYQFIQGGYDWVAHETQSHKTIFKFANPADATAFALRYTE